MVYGYRLGYPLLGTNNPGPGLPRRAYAIAENGPGVALIPNTGARVTAYDALQPGDLVFFEVEGSVDELDHVGIFVGIDSDGPLPVHVEPGTSERSDVRRPRRHVATRRRRHVLAGLARRPTHLTAASDHRRAR